MTPIEITIVLNYYSDSNLPPEDSLQIKDKSYILLSAQANIHVHCCQSRVHFRILLRGEGGGQMRGSQILEGGK